MKNPFKGLPTDGNLREATLYALYYGDVDPAISTIQYQLVDGGFDIEVDTVLHLTAPNLREVVGNNLVYVVGAALETVDMLALEICNRIVVEGSPNLTEINAPSLRIANAVEVRNCSSLVSFNLPNLETATINISINGNASMSELRVEPLNVCNEIHFQNNALPADQVNQILADLVASGWGVGGNTMNLTGANNAAPTGQGLVDLATLRARGPTITVTV